LCPFRTPDFLCVVCQEPTAQPRANSKEDSLDQFVDKMRGARQHGGSEQQNAAISCSHSPSESLLAGGHRSKCLPSQVLKPSTEDLAAVLHQLLKHPRKEKQVLGSRNSLLVHKIAGDAISEEDLDFVSISARLATGDMPIVRYLLSAHGAFTRDGMHALNSCLAGMGLS
jgi:hypothetical protein